MEPDMNIFDRKELFRLEHTPSGKSYRTANIPRRHRRKVIYNNMHLMEGMTFTQTGYPMMSPYTGTTDFEVIPYSEWRKHDGHNQALMFFLDDYRFRDAVWYNLEQTTYNIGHYDYFFTPDFSLWRNLPTEFYNQQNTFYTRFVGAYWQLSGLSTIPTASWGALNSFSYCFEGLPSNSVIAVCGLSNRKDNQAYNIWCHGLRRLEQEKHPTLILVYGPEIEVPDLKTPLKFIPGFISKRFRYGSK
jgi:hypothetical protein